MGGYDSGPASHLRNLPDERSPFTFPEVVKKPLTGPQEFLRDLLAGADGLRDTPIAVRPYWSQRKSGSSADSSDASRSAVARRFCALVQELEDLGYFERAFGKDCIDDPTGALPSELIERDTGVRISWPLKPDQFSQEPDVFYDVVEILHDLSARPSSRSMHSYNGCGWHHADFVSGVGQAIYRWRVNAIFDGSILRLRLADSGEDTGRLVEFVDEERELLVEGMLSRAVSAEDGHDQSDIDQVKHAVALFRAREASVNDKRSAVVVLARILEGRRELLKRELLTKDEGALFLIANQFDVRHQNESQKGDYNPAFLDWIFWWYLATVDLMDRIKLDQDSRTRDGSPA
ncbi:hypothetical protein [Actinokineospora globicatena]|uniref:Uncharacterized protein n=1 Tax=Actinokineospora globicatena TaxID=103729 RepID=A0A9W6QUY1_9PSEU|nr:hypothetical protein [Actinokineospora globicatena]GLW95533.1 hypothetical protein Aglo03_63490 [Actinokineospora globicatena]